MSDVYWTGVTSVTGTGWVTDDTGVLVQSSAPSNADIAYFGASLPGVDFGHRGQRLQRGVRY